MPRARAHSQERSSFNTVLLAATVLLVGLGLAALGHAAQPVIDATSHVKLTEQLNVAREQIEHLGEITKQGVEIKNKVQDQIDAVGKLGQISIPMTDLETLKRSLAREAMCLLPNLARIFPRVTLDTFDLSSVCTARKSYKDALFFDLEALQKKLGRVPTWDDQKEASLAIDNARRKLVRESASASLAAGHVMQEKTAPETRRSINALESAADSAETMQERLAVSNKQMTLLSQQVAEQNQILSEIRSLMAMQLTVLTSSAAETLERQQQKGRGGAYE